MVDPLHKPSDKADRRKAQSLRVAAKCGVCVVAFLGFVGSTTTFVARLASNRILPATQSVGDLIRSSMSFKPVLRRLVVLEHLNIGIHEQP